MLIMQRKTGLGVFSSIPHLNLTWDGPGGVNVVVKDDSETITYGNSISMFPGDALHINANDVGDTYIKPTIKILMSGAYSGTDTFDLLTAIVGNTSSPSGNMMLSAVASNVTTLGVFNIDTETISITLTALPTNVTILSTTLNTGGQASIPASSYGLLTHESQIFYNWNRLSGIPASGSGTFDISNSTLNESYTDGDLSITAAAIL